MAGAFQPSAGSVGSLGAVLLFFEKLRQYPLHPEAEGYRVTPADQHNENYLDRLTKPPFMQKDTCKSKQLRPALCTFEPLRPGVRNLATLGFLPGRCFDNAFFAGLLPQEPAVKQANGLTVRPCSMSLPGHRFVLDEK